MAVLRLRLTGQPDRIEAVCAELAESDDVIAVRDIAPPEPAFAAEDSSSANLAEDRGSQVMNIEVLLHESDEVENVFLLAETAAMEASLVMERVDEF